MLTLWLFTRAQCPLQRDRIDAEQGSGPGPVLPSICDQLAGMFEFVQRQLARYVNPGLARWIKVTARKDLKILAKTWIPTFTHCPAHFLWFRLGKLFK